jgi:N-acetylmuramoyl-L-alanine amidase
VRAFHHHFRSMPGEALDAQDLRILYNLAQQIDDGGNA